jgi:hypothetical protein
VTMSVARINYRVAAETLERLLGMVERGELAASRGQVERLEGAAIAARASATRRRSRRLKPK